MAEGHKAKLEDLDLGFRVLRQIDQREIKTGEDILWYCIISSGLTLDKKHEEMKMDGSTVFVYGKDELAACFDALIKPSVVEYIISRKPKRVFFEEISFATDEDEDEATERIKAALPECDVFTVNFRALFKRSSTQRFDEYRKGYFMALLHAMEWLMNHKDTLKHLLMNSVDGCVNCLAAMLDQIDQMMQAGERAEIKVKLLKPEKVAEKDRKEKEKAEAKRREKEANAAPNTQEGQRIKHKREAEAFARAASNMKNDVIRKG